MAPSSLPACTVGEHRDELRDNGARDPLAHWTLAGSVLVPTLQDGGLGNPGLDEEAESSDTLLRIPHPASMLGLRSPHLL